MRTRLSSILLPLLLVLVACDEATAPPTEGSSPTSAPVAATAPPVTATLPPNVQWPSPAATSTSAQATPQVTRPPEGTIALYEAGLPERADLYALGANGSANALGVQPAPGSVASGDGRWLVHLDAPQPQARALVIDNLQDGRRYSMPFGVADDCANGSCTVGLWAFDREGTRLASVEVAMDRWALVIVDLQDGSSHCIEATRTPSEGYPMPPGVPLGWADNGDLLLDAFRPFSEGAFAGVWAITLPADGQPASLGALGRRQLLDAGAYRSRPQLSPDGTRLLYLARDPGYTPASYTLNGGFEDVAVNQLWLLHLGSGERTLLVEAKDGSALAGVAAWSPGGQEVLFGQGRYEGDALASVTLKVRGASGAVRDVAVLPSPGYVSRLAWCDDDLALAATAGGLRLYSVNLTDGQASLVASAPHVSVLGCIAP